MFSQKLDQLIKYNGGKIVGIILLMAIFPFCLPPKANKDEQAKLTGEFKFTPVAFQDFPSYKHQSVREVQPSLKRINAWISATGASINLCDLNGDGLPNEYVLVDPRTDTVSIGQVSAQSAAQASTQSAAQAKAPSFQPFVLEPKGFNFDPATMCPSGTICSDINEDGLNDIVVYYWGRTPVAFVQQGSARSTALPTTTTASNPPLTFKAMELVPGKERWFTGTASQADFDGDGHYDLVFGNSPQDGAHILDKKAPGVEVLHDSKSNAVNGGYKHFLLWKNNKFVEAKTNLPDEALRGWTTAMASFDLNNDGLPELYIANDVGPDRFLFNESTPGHLNFRLLIGKRNLTSPKSCVMGKDSFKGMGVDINDINGDGLFDMFVSNIAAKFKFLESHLLWINDGNLASIKDGIAPFYEASTKYGLSQSGWAWECRIADFNNDTIPEVIQAMGFIKGKVNRWPELQALGTVNDQLVSNPTLWPSFKQGDDVSGDESNAFFVRDARGIYHDLGKEVGLGTPMLSRGIAIADVDHDGDLDFALANQWETSYFYRNDSPRQGNFVGLNLIHKNGSPVIGAVARLPLKNGTNMIAQVDGGSGHSGKRSQDIFLATGGEPGPYIIKLSWRNKSGQDTNKYIEVNSGWHQVVLD